MRIIAGRFRSRALAAPAGMATRPTSDRLRETLFNVLAPRISGAHFLDLYAGSGAVGIEAISRGAACADFIEKAPPALAALRANLGKLGITEGFRIRTGSVGPSLRKLKADLRQEDKFDIVFLDPPYDASIEYAATLRLLGGDANVLLDADGVVIVEHRRKEQLDGQYGVLMRSRLLEQGDAALSFYKAHRAIEDGQE